MWNFDVLTNSSCRYVDTHCHLDYILQKMHISSVQQLKTRFTSSFEACISYVSLKLYL